VLRVPGQVGHCEVDAVGFEQPVCGDEGEACDSAEFAELGSAELKVSCGQWLCAFIDAFADSGEQDFVAAGELAGHDDGGGVENADESGDGFTDDATCIADIRTASIWPLRTRGTMSATASVWTPATARSRCRAHPPA
jgi:hypothetical protein